MVIVRKSDDIFSFCAHQFGWQHQEIGAYGIQGLIKPLLGEAEPFEPVNDIGRKQENLKEGHIGGPAVGWDFAHGVVVEKFPVVLFDRGPGVVKEVDPPRCGFEIGGKDMVDIALVLEEGQLPGLGGVFWYGTPDRYKAMLLLVFVVNFLPKFSRLPSAARRCKPASPGPGFDSGILFGYDDVPAPYSAEKPYHPPTIEAGVHAESDTRVRDILGDLGQAYLQEGNDPGGGGGVPGTKHAVPKLLKMGLETEQGMVGTPAGFLGVVSDAGSLLGSVKNNDHRIEIEDQGGSPSGQGKQVRSQTVVQAGQLADSLGAQAFEKATQAGLIGESHQAQHLQEGSVVLQNLGLVDALESHDDGKHKDQEHLGRMIGGASLAGLNIALQQTAQAQFVAKTLDQPHSAKVGDMGFLECNRDFSGTFWHLTESTPWGCFVSCSFYQHHPDNFPSEIVSLGGSKNVMFAHF